MEIILHKVCGRPARQPVQVRRCLPGQEQLLFALQNEVHAAMPHPEQFVPDPLEGLASYLVHDLCVGAWQGGRLGAFFILRYCGMDEHNYANVLGVPRDQWPLWANADSVIVHPDWRGNGLQRRLFQIALDYARPGLVGVGATVSPDNAYSLNNALASGFTIACRREMYGGFDRYVLQKKLK